MSLIARITPIWRKQKLFVAVFLLGFGAFFFWDGLVRWPRANERFLKHEELTKAGKHNEWVAYAKERGWTTTPPEKLHTRGDIIGQYVCGSITGLAGLLALLYWLQQVRRTITL